MSENTGVRVEDVPTANRYEAHIGDTLAGILSYVDGPGARVLQHTVVRSEHDGKGVGSALAAFALDAARAAGEQIVPQCTFVAGYIERHPEYADLVA